MLGGAISPLWPYDGHTFTLFCMFRFLAPPAQSLASSRPPMKDDVRMQWGPWKRLEGRCKHRSWGAWGGLVNLPGAGAGPAAPACCPRPGRSPPPVSAGPGAAPRAAHHPHRLARGAAGAQHRPAPGSRRLLGGALRGAGTQLSRRREFTPSRRVVCSQLGRTRSDAASEDAFIPSTVSSQKTSHAGDP